MASDHGSRPGRHALEDLLAHDGLLHVRPYSTVGDSPVTVIVSLRLPTSSLALIVATKAALIADVRALDGLEPLQLELDVVVAGRQAVEPIGAARVGGERLRAADQALAGQCHAARPAGRRRCCR